MNPALMDQGANDLVENLVQMSSDVFGKKSQNVITILLQQAVLFPVAPIGVSIAEMLRSIEFNNQSISGIKKIDFHMAATAKGNWQIAVQAEQISGGFKGLETAIEKRFAGAPGPPDSVRIRTKIA